MDGEVFEMSESKPAKPKTEVNNAENKETIEENPMLTVKTAKVLTKHIIAEYFGENKPTNNK